MGWGGGGSHVDVGMDSDTISFQYSSIVEARRPLSALPSGCRLIHVWICIVMAFVLTGFGFLLMRAPILLSISITVPWWFLILTASSADCRELCDCQVCHKIHDGFIEEIKLSTVSRRGYNRG